MPNPPSQTQPEAVVTILPKGQTIRVAPDAVTRKVCDAPAALIPRLGLVDYQPAGDGTFRPVVKIHEQWIRVSVAARALGVYHNILRRLIAGGFIDAIQPSPGCWLMSLHSYFKHVEAVRNDPDFWNEKRRRQYSEAL